jgi:hypothetical protein
MAGQYPGKLVARPLGAGLNLFRKLLNIAKEHGRHIFLVHLWKFLAQSFSWKNQGNERSETLLAIEQKICWQAASNSLSRSGLIMSRISFPSLSLGSQRIMEPHG